MKFSGEELLAWDLEVETKTRILSSQENINIIQHPIFTDCHQ